MQTFSVLTRSVSKWSSLSDASLEQKSKGNSFSAFHNLLFLLTNPLQREGYQKASVIYTSFVFYWWIDALKDTGLMCRPWMLAGTTLSLQDVFHCLRLVFFPHWLPLISCNIVIKREQINPSLKAIRDLQEVSYLWGRELNLRTQCLYYDSPTKRKHADHNSMPCDPERKRAELRSEWGKRFHINAGHSAHICCHCWRPYWTLAFRESRILPLRLMREKVIQDLAS